MPIYQTLIVGSHFRPPAKQLLAVLPSGHPLRLEEENDNPYDAAAVRVMLDLMDGNGTSLLTEYQLAQLEAELPNFGITLDQLMSTGPVKLGFVPAQDGKPLAKARSGLLPACLGNQQVRELMPRVRASLGTALDGGVIINLEAS